MTKQLVLSVVAALGSFGLVAFCISWFPLRPQRIHSAEKVVQGLTMRVLAVPATLHRQQRRLRRGGSVVPPTDTFPSGEHGLHTVTVTDTDTTSISSPATVIVLSCRISSSQRAIPATRRSQCVCCPNTSSAVLFLRP